MTKANVDVQVDGCDIVEVYFERGLNICGYLPGPGGSFSMDTGFADRGFFDKYAITK